MDNPFVKASIIFPDEALIHATREDLDRDRQHLMIARTRHVRRILKRRYSLAGRWAWLKWRWFHV